MAMHSRRVPKRKETNSLMYFVQKYLLDRKYDTLIIREWLDKKERVMHLHYLNVGDSITHIPKHVRDQPLRVEMVVYTRHNNGHRTKSLKLETV